jgi:LAS superfamily LD-carboxypeptidase LdcB
MITFWQKRTTENIAGKTKTTTDKAMSRQSHRLLTSKDVVRENLLLAQKKSPIPSCIRAKDS